MKEPHWVREELGKYLKWWKKNIGDSEVSKIAREVEEGHKKQYPFEHEMQEWFDTHPKFYDDLCELSEHLSSKSSGPNEHKFVINCPLGYWNFYSL